MAKRKKIQAGIIYRGPSMLDGQPIVVVAIAASDNDKTGGLVATYILPENVSPMEAIHTGADFSICGDCKHRGTKGTGGDRPRSCYVQVAQAPQGIWNKVKGLTKYQYPVIEDLAAYGHGQTIRLGAYGDPAAVPVGIWNALLTDCYGSVGYTHQWKTHNHLRTMCMASVDSESELVEAESMGWRCFRVTADAGDIDKKLEIMCPASKEAGQRTTCASCLLCSGSVTRKGNPSQLRSVAIPAHGGIGLMLGMMKDGVVPTLDRVPTVVDGKVKRVFETVDTVSPPVDAGPRVVSLR